MSTDPTHPAANLPTTDEERRRHPRFAADGVFTAMGRVLNISASGMRVHAEPTPPLEPGDRFRLELKDGQRVCLFPAELISTQPAGNDNASDLGLAFGKLAAEQTRTINDIIERNERLDTLHVAWQPAPPTDDQDLEEDEDVYSADDSFAGLILDPEPADNDPSPEVAALEQLADTAKQCLDIAQSDDTNTTPNTTVTARMTMVQGGDDDARQANPGEVNQRRAGRLAAEDATTSLGKVLDISANGLRIRRKGAAPLKVGNTFMIDLQAAGRVLRAPVEVVRIQKVGWRTFDYGLKFGELGDDIRAEFGRFTRMVSCCSDIT